MEAVIPESVSSIGTDAFANCPNLFVTIVAGSYAEDYCRENGIPIGCYIDNEIPLPVVTYPTITDYTINGESGEVTAAVDDILNLSGAVTAGMGDKLKAL